MDFSTMVLTMYFAAEDDRATDPRIIDIAVEETLLAASLGFNPWFTEHHFRGPWHSNPIQFASYMAPQIPPERYLGFGVISTPFYHPVRLVESMNLLDQLTKGHTLFGIGSGFPGIEPASMGLETEYHGSGRATRDALHVMEQLWQFSPGDPLYTFNTPNYRGSIERRIIPSAYDKPHPTIIRTASRNSAVVEAARRGWPAFLGSFGSESPLAAQWNLYRHTLAEANHLPEIVAECLRWCTVDWLSVVVAETDARAKANAEIAVAEQAEVRQRFIDRFGPMAPIVRREAGQAESTTKAVGPDAMETIAGSPATVAARVAELCEMGINHLMVRFLGEWTGRTRWVSEESMRHFSRDVMPQFVQHASGVAGSTGGS